MTAIRLTNAAEPWAPDDTRSERAGAPVRTDYDPLPAIDASPILMRAPEGRRAIPDFDGEDDAPLDIADLVRQAEDVAEAGVKTWPDIWPAPRRRADGPDGTVDGLVREITARRDEIAGLQEVQQKQNAALRRARDEIVSLDDAVKLSRARLTQQEKETRAAKRALQESDGEKTALRAELEQTKANFAELLQKTTGLNAAFDQREKEIAAVRQSVASLKAELAAKAGETDLKAAIEDAKTRYYREFGKRFAQFQAQVENMARMIGARDEHISTLEDENATLRRRCEALADDGRQSGDGQTQRGRKTRNADRHRHLPRQHAAGGARPLRTQDRGAHRRGAARAAGARDRRAGVGAGVQGTGAAGTEAGAAAGPRRRRHRTRGPRGGE